MLRLCIPELAEVPGIVMGPLLDVSFTYANERVPTLIRRRGTSSIAAFSLILERAFLNI